MRERENHRTGIKGRFNFESTADRAVYKDWARSRMEEKEEEVKNEVVNPPIVTKVDTCPPYITWDGEAGKFKVSDKPDTSWGPNNHVCILRK